MIIPHDLFNKKKMSVLNLIYYFDKLEVTRDFNLTSKRRRIFKYQVYIVKLTEDLSLMLKKLKKQEITESKLFLCLSSKKSLSLRVFLSVLL